jgi:GIY-YIG catalytic domain.
MASPKGFILYKIWYGDCLAYLGRTKQPLQARMRGHMFAKPMHRAIDIHNVTKIEYTMLSTEADMNLYEIYFINLYKPPLNVDDKAKDNLTIVLPDLEWTEFVPSKWEEWKSQLKSEDMYGWHKLRNQHIEDMFGE